MYPSSITQISYSNMAASVPDDLCIVAIHLSDNLSAFVVKLQSAYCFVLSMFCYGFLGNLLRNLLFYGSTGKRKRERLEWEQSTHLFKT